MSKVSKLLTDLRNGLDATEGDTLPKAELVAGLDQVIENLPQAAAMDEQQLDIFVTYMKHLSTKMDLLFSATALCGLGLSNDFKVRGTIKDLESKFKAAHAQLEGDLRQIIDPGYADEVKANREHVNEVLKNDQKK